MADDLSAGMLSYNGQKTTQLKTEWIWNNEFEI
jgi:hypothetical protein